MLAATLIFVIIEFKVTMELTNILVKLFQFGATLTGSSYVVELFEVVSVVRIVGIHVVAWEFRLIRIVIREALTSCLPSLSKRIFLYTQP